MTGAEIRDATPGRAAPPADRLLVAVPVISVGIAFLVVALAAIDLWQGYEVEVRHQRAVSQGLVRVVESEVAGMIQGAEVVLEALGELSVEAPDAPTAARLAAAHPEISVLLVLDALGRVRHASAPGWLGRELGNEAWFGAQWGTAEGELYVSAPGPSPAGGGLALLLSRRAGPCPRCTVLAGMLDGAAVSGLLAGVDVGRTGAVWLLHRDGGVIARSPTGPAATGFDGVRRIVSRRSLPGLPLVVAVGVGRAEGLAGWRHGALLASLCLAVVLVLWVWLSRRLMRELGHRRALADAVRRSSEGLAEAQRIARLGSWQLGPVPDQVTLSEEACRIAGRSGPACGGSVPVFHELFHPDDRERLRAALGAALATGSPLDLQCRLLRPDDADCVVRVRSQRRDDAPAGEVGLVGTIQDVTQQVRQEERIQYLAYHDSVTGLANSALLTERLAFALSAAGRSGTRVAVLFIDLDRFKSVNDSLGHEQGDRVLRQAAERLQATVRATDTVSRMGGDEFVLVLPGVGTERNGAHVAEKLITAINQPFFLDGGEIALAPSLGIALFPENGEDGEALLRNADAAMYAAKQEGGNRYRFYSASMNLRARERLALEGDLRHAVDRGELYLEYQVQVELASRRIEGVEALLRWNHPRRGVVMPREFIPVAEESGLIVPIGQWVLETACRQLAAWRRAGLEIGRMAVNVSARQFQEPGFCAVVEQCLARSGLDATALELEVTETVIMRASELVLEKVRLMAAKGVALSIDDFGIGYSSLNYLRQFPVQRIKIDQSFVRGLPDRREDLAIVQAIISLGHSLGISVLAEGVESQAQASLLLSMWCDCAQGFEFARPWPPAELEAFVRQQEWQTHREGIVDVSPAEVR